MKNSFDLLLAGGTVLDPASGLNQKLDVGISGSRIASIEAGVPREKAKQALDVTGHMVLTPIRFAWPRV